MKIRRGFVTNSSSSSFIIGLDRIPTDKCDLGRILNVRNFNYYEGEIEMLYNDIVDKLCEDGAKHKIEPIDVITKILYGYEPDEDEIQDEDMKTANKIVEEANKHKYNIILEYGDDGGDIECNLEHGGIFDSIVIHKESHH